MYYNTVNPTSTSCDLISCVHYVLLKYSGILSYVLMISLRHILLNSCNIDVYVFLLTSLTCLRFAIKFVYVT